MRGFIYKISCEDRWYIGSTTQSLEDRLFGHKMSSRRQTFPLYQYINTHGGWSNVKMELLEEVEVESRRDLRFLEREYLFTCKDEFCLNSDSPYTTQEERKAQKLQAGKVYSKKHLQEIRERNRIYSLANKEKYADYYAKYREEHRQQQVEYMKLYNEKKKNTS